MALKNINIGVSLTGIEPSIKQIAGVQGDHNVTSISFVLNSDIVEALITEAVGKGIFYRVVGIDSTGRKVSTEFKELEIIAGADNTVKYLIERWLSQNGGTSYVQLVLAVIEAATEESYVELYCFSLPLEFQPSPSGVDVDPSDPSDVRLSAMIASKAASHAEEIAAELTTYIPTHIYDPQSPNPQSGRALASALANYLPIDRDIVIVLDGGDAGGVISVEYVVDNHMSDTSINPVENHVVKKYIDAFVDELNERFDGLEKQSTCYVVEEGVDGIWKFLKWSNGDFQCCAILEGLKSGVTDADAYNRLSLPFSIYDPIIHCTNYNTWGIREIRVIPDSSDSAITIGLYVDEPAAANSNASISVNIQGRWK